MNKWQIICPLTAMLLFALVLGVISSRNHRRAHVLSMAHEIGSELIASTNSTRLVHIEPELQSALSELLTTHTTVADVTLGDAAASSSLVLSNDIGRTLSIRLQQTRTGTFEVVDFQSVPD